MKRIIFMILCWFPFVPFWYYKLCKYGDTEKYSQEERYNFIRQIAIRGIKVGRVDVIETGIENLPKENGYLVTPNHQGLFDTLMIFKTHERPFNVVNKIELENTRGIRRVFKALGAHSMDRNDVRQSMGVIIQISKDLANGMNYVIFPEGTRSRNGNNLLEFKGGTYKAATKAKAPIVPVALIDSFKPFDCGNIKRCTTQIHYMKPLYYEDYKDMKTTEIAAYVHDLIQNKIDEELAKGTE